MMTEDRKRPDLLEAYTASLSGWQPISTAPKDGTRVLLFALGYMRRWNIWGLGFYFKGVPGDGEGWIAHSFYSQPDTMSGSFEPTHWMRLPAPPTS